MGFDKKYTYIYALIDPRYNTVRYIGKANNPKDRYTNHYNSARDKNTHKRNWINNVRLDGARPELLIIDKVNIDEWQFWESFYIALYKSYGFILLNYTIGGDGTTFGNKGSFKIGNIPHNKGVPCSEETKRKIRDRLTGVPNIISHKKIIQYDLKYNIIDRYESITAAVKKSNGFFSRSKISSCCLFKRNHHQNYIWRYDDGVDVIKVDIKLGKKGVIQYDRNHNKLNEFLSVKEAADSTGCYSVNICYCCRGKLKTSGGFIWRYIKN